MAMAEAGAMALGEALVEFVRPGTGQPLDMPGAFAGPYVGGAPAIFAGACARLGLPTVLLCTLGDDAFGRLVRLQEEGAGVDCRYVATDPTRPTACSFVAYAPDGRRDFVFYVRAAAAAVTDPGWPPAAALAATRWLHVCGSTLALGESWAETLVRAARRARERGAYVSFDPNVRTELLGGRTAAALCAPMLALANVVLPSGDEAVAITGAETPEEGCGRLLRDGADLVVLKRGAGGATAFTHRGRHDAAGFAVEEVDPTGAGDVFAASLARDLLAGRALSTALRRACAAGALAVTRTGPLDGAPTGAELDAFLSVRRPA